MSSNRQQQSGIRRSNQMQPTRNVRFQDEVPQDDRAMSRDQMMRDQMSRSQMMPNGSGMSRDQMVTNGQVMPTNGSGMYNGQMIRNGQVMPTNGGTYNGQMIRNGQVMSADEMPVESSTTGPMFTRDQIGQMMRDPMMSPESAGPANQDMMNDQMESSTMGPMFARGQMMPNGSGMSRDQMMRNRMMSGDSDDQMANYQMMRQQSPRDMSRYQALSRYAPRDSYGPGGNWNGNWGSDSGFMRSPLFQQAILDGSPMWNSRRQDPRICLGGACPPSDQVRCMDGPSYGGSWGGDGLPYSARYGDMNDMDY